MLEASNAEQAIRIAETFTDTIHLLLTDVIMPGMSGRLLAEKILSKRPQTRVVYMTGYTDDMVVQHRVLEPGVKFCKSPLIRSNWERRCGLLWTVCDLRAACARDALEGYAAGRCFIPIYFITA